MLVGTSQIELLVNGAPSEHLRTALAGAGYAIDSRKMEDSRVRSPAQLYVIDAGKQVEQALRLCRRLRAEPDGAFTPILLVTAEIAPALRLASLQAGADALLTQPFDDKLVVAAVQALLRVKERHDLLAGQAAEANVISRRLQEAQQQMNQELEMARRLQESFLPQSLPDLPNVRFAVKYKPASRVGGDFYDIFRLDEKHVAFYVADAMGHGIPASLLTIFVKKSVRAKEITGQTYRLVPPTEVLYKLNRDLLEQQIPDLPFITMAYVLFNHSEGTLQFSRAGHPYPLYIPKTGQPTLWQIEGSLLGVFETKFRVQSQQLKPRDKLLLYTDGMDGASFEQHAVGLASLLAAAEQFRDLPIDELVERLASDLFTQTRQHDDLTIFGVEMVD
jgi:sigma-B regulation protein RsbU (phosphoserine phosphatase)